MKKFFYIIFIAISAIVISSALIASVTEMQDLAETEISSDSQSGTAENILRNSDFGHLFAYNAIKGTTEKLNAADSRQVLVYRNSYSGPSAYSQASSKRQTSSGLKWHIDAGVTHSFPERYYLLGHNVNLLDRGMSSNSERIHLLRILII